VRHVRMLGLCLVAVFAVGAYAVSSAMAGPQWVKCEAKAGGNYSDSNCKVKAKPKGTGGYELLKAPEVAAKREAEGKSPGVPFKGESVGSGGLLYAELGSCEKNGPEEPLEQFFGPITRAACEAKGAHRVNEAAGPFIQCAAENSEGEASGTSSVVGVHVTFTGCNLFGNVPCENAGPEEIITNELKGKLGYISKANHEVGVLLEPAVKHGDFADFSCEPFVETIKVGVGNKKVGSAHTTSGCDQECPGATPEEEKHGGYDGVISPIKPVNEMTNAFTQEYKVEPTEFGEVCPENIPSHFEGKHIDLLEVQQSTQAGSTMWSCSGEEITNVNTPEEAGEIKA
jgi:hypothetical protein